MASLKSDLDEYLLLQSDQKKNFNFKMELKMPSIKMPSSASGLFRMNNSEPEAANGWLRDARDSCCPKLSRIQRIIGFVLCLGLGVFFLIVSTFYIPVLVLKARKFALLYTMASLFFILAFGFLSGFAVMMRQMFATKERMWLSISYVGCLMATLYFSIIYQSTPFTVLFAVAQIIALFWLVLGSVPGGSSGLKFFGQLFKSSVSSTLPV